MPGNPITADCCSRTLAVDRDAAFCGDCGRPLLRCMAFEECGGLIGRDGVCQTCVRPVLDIDPSAVRDAQIGNVLTLPFKLRNDSPAGRPVFVTGLWIRTGDEPRREAELLWERLDAGGSAPMPVRTSVLAQGGTHRVEVAFSLETRFRWRTESYLFASSMDVTVEGDRASTVNQTINLTADTIEPGATVYAPVRSEARPGAERGTTVDLELVHAERLELELGLRGVDKSWRVPRGIRLKWRNFPQNEAPADGMIASADGVLAIGRNRTKRQSGDGDVRLLARRGAEVDQDVSVMISRRHCEMFIQNDRLMIRAESDAGLLVDGEYLSRGDVAVIRPGAVVSLLKNYPDAAAMKVEVERHHGVASDVLVTRLG